MRDPAYLILLGIIIILVIDHFLFNGAIGHFFMKYIMAGISFISGLLGKVIPF